MQWYVAVVLFRPSIDPGDKPHLSLASVNLQRHCISISSQEWNHPYQSHTRLPLCRQMTTADDSFRKRRESWNTWTMVVFQTSLPRVRFQSRKRVASEHTTNKTLQEVIFDFETKICLELFEIHCLTQKGVFTLEKAKENEISLGKFVSLWN